MSDNHSIFISYRRSDTSGHGRALHEYLSGRFGDNRVFFDRSTIESGDVFPDRLRRGVERCAVLLVLIGPEWLDVRGDDGGRRLDDADDFVRREIALALEQGKKVIPVLFDDTPVPSRDRLPDPLKSLANCDALTLRGKTYEYQTQRQELVRLLAKPPEPLSETGQGEAASFSGPLTPTRIARDIPIPIFDTYIALYNYIAKTPYTYDGCSRLFDVIKQQDDPQKVINNLGKICIDLWRSNIDISGIASVILTYGKHYWQVNNTIYDKLEHRFTKSLKKDRIEYVGILEPLGFFFGASASHRLHYKMVKRFIDCRDWRMKDNRRVVTYYGNSRLCVNAIQRHIHHRSTDDGILLANDIGRILWLLEDLYTYEHLEHNFYEMGDQKQLTKKLEDLFGRSIGALQKSSSDELARPAIRYYNHLRTDAHN